MSHWLRETERHFDKSAIYEDAINAIDATANITVDEAQAVLDEMTDEEVQAMFAGLLVANVSDPKLKNLQRKAESIIEAMRIEELTAQKVREMSMKLVKTGRFWSVLSMNNNCFYMSLDMKEALEKLAELRGRSK